MSAAAKNWFDVDREGLAKLLADRSPAFILFELFSNCADTDAKRIEITLTPVAGKPFSMLVVRDDDPCGFADLSHAWTLFAESARKGDAEKRGRFNLGEKLALASCVYAYITTTTGAVSFDAEGRRVLRRRTERGSVFEAMIRMTREHHDQAAAEFTRVIPPEGVEVTFNGRVLCRPALVASFSAKLPTVIADEEGFLQRRDRETVVDVYEPVDRSGMVFELGVPVVETGDRWDYDVRQKVPLTSDRDNVPPTYLRTLRALALNETAHLLSEADAARPWVQQAASSPLVSAEANDRVLTLQYGELRAIRDPNDHEANKELMNRGYAIIEGGSLSAERWENVRRDGIAQPSGQIAPSGVKYSADGRPERVVDPASYTAGQRGLVEFTQDLAWKLIGKHVEARIVNEPPSARPQRAWYGHGRLTFNLGRLGRSWFEGPIGRCHLELIFHELAHDLVSDHLTREFSNEVGRLAAKALDLALVDPSFFTYHGYTNGRG